MTRFDHCPATVFRAFNRASYLLIAQKKRIIRKKTLSSPSSSLKLHSALSHASWGYSIYLKRPGRTLHFVQQAHFQKCPKSPGPKGDGIEQKRSSSCLVSSGGNISASNLDETPFFPFRPLQFEPSVGKNEKNIPLFRLPGGKRQRDVNGKLSGNQFSEIVTNCFTVKNADSRFLSCCFPVRKKQKENYDQPCQDSRSNFGLSPS